MQYRVPKKIYLALSLALLPLAGTLSLAVFTVMEVGYAPLNIAAALIGILLSVAVVTRFVMTGCAYRLGEAYEDYTLYLYRIVRNKSHLVGKVELTGAESLIPLDRKGRKTVKGRKFRGDMTANLVPHKRYALLFEDSGVDCYLILELNPAMVHAIEERIALAKAYFIDL